jgi:hypothetical protein
MTVGVKNNLSGEAGLICKQNSCRKFGVLCTLQHKPMCRLILKKVIFGAQTLLLLPMDRMELLLAYSIPHKTMISTEFMGNCAGA